MTSTTQGRIENLGNGAYIVLNPSVIVVRNSKTSEKVATFTNWDDADDFIAAALISGVEYDIAEEAI